MHFHVRWSLTENDIRTTLRSVCHKALRDRSVGELERRRRVEGLLIVGTVFLQSGGFSEAGLDLAAIVGALKESRMQDGLSSSSNECSIHLSHTEYRVEQDSEDEEWLLVLPQHSPGRTGVSPTVPAVMEQSQSS